MDRSEMKQQNRQKYYNKNKKSFNRRRPQNDKKSTETEKPDVTDETDLNEFSNETVETLESNHSYYENEIEEYDDEEFTGSDYKQLANTIIQADSHFQFNSEKNWDTDFKHISSKSNKIFQKYFNINISKIESSLMEIPFYKRMDIDPKFFNESEILVMEMMAKNHRQRRNENEICTKKSDTLKQEQAKDQTNTEIKKTENMSVVEDIQNLNLNNSEKQNKTDMQKWLDDVLFNDDE